MQYNSHATSQDCISEVLKICNATTATYPLVDITRRFNNALDWFVELGAKVGKKWPFDDSNQTSSPIATQTITSGTNSYKWSAFSGTNNVFANKLTILDSNGVEQPLIPEGFAEIDFAADYPTTITGVPTNYVKVGDFIFLRPTPNYSLAAALRAYVTRAAMYMASTDTTKVPGVPSLFHMALCRYASLPFLVEHNLPQVNAVMRQIQKDERDILDFFGYRNNDSPNRLVGLRQNNR